MLEIKNLFAVVLIFGHLIAVLFFHCFPELYSNFNPPELPDQYFGRGKLLIDPNEFPADKPAIKKFEIHVADSILEDLNGRLNNTKFPEPLDNVEFQYGFHVSYLKEVVGYWKDNFDWRKQEKILNKFSHYITQIEGIDVHFIHQKPDLKGKEVKIYPLLMVHGWPRSIAEFTRVLPLLTTPRIDRDYVFEVICPSIPGFGFSEAPHQTGFNMASAARIFSKLMDRLGFSQYYLHGGNWGSPITSIMAVAYPEKVIGAHLTMLVHKIDSIALWKYAFGRLFPSLFMNKDEAAKYYPISKLVSRLVQKTGYFHIQAIKPDSIGTALSDSPMGLAAYILENFSTGTDISFQELKDEGLTKKISLDELLINVMIYWSTNTMTSSMRFYKENMEKIHERNFQQIPIQVPVGVAAFPNEYFVMPWAIIKHTIPNIVRYSYMPRGGHFAAMEEPVLLADDIWDFVMDVEKSKIN